MQLRIQRGRGAATLQFATNRAHSQGGVDLLGSGARSIKSRQTIWTRGRPDLPCCRAHGAAGQMRHGKLAGAEHPSVPAGRSRGRCVTAQDERPPVQKRSLSLREALPSCPTYPTAQTVTRTEIARMRTQIGRALPHWVLLRSRSQTRMLSLIRCYCAPRVRSLARNLCSHAQRPSSDATTAHPVFCPNSS